MKYLLLGLIQIYKMIPFSTHNSCKFYPTCSDYAIISLRKYNTLKALKLIIKRLLKCNPFNKNVGIDLVP